MLTLASRAVVEGGHFTHGPSGYTSGFICPALLIKYVLSLANEADHACER
jgi:hypothetical protein